MADDKRGLSRAVGGADEVVAVYRNHRGEVRRRRLRPVQMWFGKTEFHPKPQWLVKAVDLERSTPSEVVVRDFAWSGFLAVGQEECEAYDSVQAALRSQLVGG